MPCCASLKAVVQRSKLSDADYTDDADWNIRNPCHLRYLRLKNVEFGYTLPNKLTRKWLMENVRFYFIGNTLAIWDKFKWWDPEGTREDGSNYPINKTFSCYLQFSF